MRRPRDEEEAAAMLASVPAGWFWDDTMVFESKSEAKNFIKEVYDEDGHEEAKAIKRGGTSNPYHLVIVRPYGVCTLESPCPACARRLAARSARKKNMDDSGIAH